MEQNRPSEAGSLSTSHEIPHVLWKQKFHYCAHNSPPSTEPEKSNVRDPSIFLSIISMSYKLPTST